MAAYAGALPWEQLLLATAARIEASGKPVLVVLSPPVCVLSPEILAAAAKGLGVAPSTVDPALPGRVTLALADRVGLPRRDILDLTPALAAKTPSGEDAYTGVDTHWSVAGNAWVGELLAEQLLARWPGLGRPGAPATPPPPEAAGATDPAALPVALPGPVDQDLAASLVAGCPGR
jgi:hypothetical protein